MSLSFSVASLLPRSSRSVTSAPATQSPSFGTQTPYADLRSSDTVALRFGHATPSLQVNNVILSPDMPVDRLQDIAEKMWNIKLRTLGEGITARERNLWGWMPIAYRARGAENIEGVVEGVQNGLGIFAVSFDKSDDTKVLGSSGVNVLSSGRLAMIEGDKPAIDVQKTEIEGKEPALPSGGFKPNEFSDLIVSNLHDMADAGSPITRVTREDITRLFADDKIGELQFVYLDRIAKGKGLAHNLTEQVIQENAAKKTYPIIVLQVQHKRAREIYESLGFQVMEKDRPNANGTKSSYMIRIEPDLLEAELAKLH